MMNRNRQEKDEDASAPLTDYRALCYGSLFVVLLALLNRGFGGWSLLAVVTGVLALQFRWQSGPVLLLVAVAWLFVSDSMGLTPGSLASSVFGVIMSLFGAHVAPSIRETSHTSPTEGMVFADLVLVIGALGFCAGHYRIQSIIQHVFPIDPRNKQRPKQKSKGFWFWRPRPKLVEEKRPVETATRKEIALLVVKIPLWAGLAEVGWLLLSSSRGNRTLNMQTGSWRVILLIWVFGLTLALAGFVVNYLSWRKRSAREGLLASQDILWQETRVEQRRVARWLAWFKRKAPVRKDKQ
ncbi:MAG: hypothetical protein ACJ8FY_23095 [Gemmataceae bacterium]